jgi:hypothetical protein
MPKKYRPKNSTFLQNVETSSIEKRCYDGKVPSEDFIALEQELLGLQYGSVSLTVFIRNGEFQYSLIEKAFTRSKDDD